MQAALGPEMEDTRPSVNKIAWTLCLLVLATWALDRVAYALLLNVFGRHQLTSYWPSLLVPQTFLIAMALLSVELAVVLYFYRPLRRFFTLPVEHDRQEHVRHRFAIGLIGGVCAFLASIPFLLAPYSFHIITAQLLSYSAASSTACQIALLLVVLPILSELVFRGIVFSSFRDASSFWPAAIASSLLFGYVWPVPTAPIAVILGVVSALVFQKTRALASSIITNATMSGLVTTFLLLRDLRVL